MRVSERDNINISELVKIGGKMYILNYPIPVRTNYIPLEEADADGISEIGWNTGMTNDGRPFKAEMWALCLSVVTIFLSSEGIEEYSEEELIAMLENEGLLKNLKDPEQLLSLKNH